VDRLTVLKIACALAGVGIFAWGVRSEDNIIRWVGIAFVIAAFLLRFARKRVPVDDDEDETP
jgi:Na+(H+)/acetate symporter ActP